MKQKSSYILDQNKIDKVSIVRQYSQIDFYKDTMTERDCLILERDFNTPVMEIPYTAFEVLYLLAFTNSLQEVVQKSKLLCHYQGCN